MKEFRSLYINNEINNSLTQIENNKRLAIGAIKIYLMIFFALFTYGAFLQTKIVLLSRSKSLEIIPEQYLMFAIFGVALTVMTSSMGWVLLDYITGLIYRSVINYKHIGYMRKLTSDLFFGGLDDEIHSLRKYCALPFEGSVIHLQRTRHLPIVFSAMNVMLLSMNYYFLQTSLCPKLSLTITYSIILLFVLFFPNACKKLEEEKIIAKRIKPKSTDEQKIRSYLDRVKRFKKRTRPYKLLRYLLDVLVTLMIFSIGFVGVIYNNIDKCLRIIPKLYFVEQFIVLLAITLIVYLLAMIETAQAQNRQRKRRQRI